MCVLDLVLLAGLSCVGTLGGLALYLVLELSYRLVALFVLVFELMEVFGANFTTFLRGEFLTRSSNIRTASNCSNSFMSVFPLIVVVNSVIALMRTSCGVIVGWVMYSCLNVTVSEKRSALVLLL